MKAAVAYGTKYVRNVQHCGGCGGCCDAVMSVVVLGDGDCSDLEDVGQYCI